MKLPNSSDGDCHTMLSSSKVRERGNVDDVMFVRTIAGALADNEYSKEP